MNSKLDPLMDALECIGSDGDNMNPCRMEMCPYFDTYDPNSEWPCDFIELARAAKERISRLEEEARKQIALKDTLVLRCKVFAKREDFDSVCEGIISQMKAGTGCILVPNCFDVMMVPEGTEVRIEDCVK